MRISPDSPVYATIKKAVNAALSHPDMPTHAMYVARDESRIPRIASSKDVEMRYRWDLLWLGARLTGVRVVDLYTDDINDAHIDTALRHILNAMETV